ncbi:MAG: MlaD family protein [Desulfobacterales bacterium]|nr:MlaD family protein [Desulfobacterales bacterium]
MTTSTDDAASPINAPRPDIKKRRSISIVWIVPVVAILIGGWLVFKAVTEKGPTIYITFRTAEGLVAGKTKVRFKDVEVGTVKSIIIPDDLTHVRLTVEMVKGARPFLKEGAQFWVVRARVAAGQVSGLGTLFSGAYIGMEPSTEGEPKREFEGLEVPPVVTADQDGFQFSLTANRLGSLNYGSPVYYRQIQAGQVVGYTLDPAGKSVTVKIFINAPYHNHVRTNTRFWETSGIQVNMSASGVQVDTESFVSMMIGGIAFGVPGHEQPAAKASENTRFLLFDDFVTAAQRQYTIKSRGIMFFSDSVRGLEVGAPVEFQGIKIGEVIDIDLQFDPEKVEFQIPVTVEIEPERIGMGYLEQSRTEELAMDQKLLDKGLRAQLKTGNLLTGKLFVDLDFYPDAEPATMRSIDGQTVIPTVPTTIEAITASLNRFMKRIDKMPLESIARDLQKAVAGVDRIVNSPEIRDSLGSLKQIMADVRQLTTSANAETMPRINSALDQLDRTLIELNGVINADAPLRHDLRATLKELAGTARALRELAEFLDRHPESLIRGKGTESP